MQLTVLAPGKVRKSYLREGCDDYLARLQHYTRTQIVEVREESAGRGVDPGVVKRREAQRLLEKVPPGALLIALDERGESLTSVALAELIGAQRDRGQKDLVFVIGGPLGLAPELLARAQRRLSLSAMTLPHELVRLILLEQCYRAFTILLGEPYHNP
jgi:23S rRNA (pseudouridine1915-N3)-methyltransferase